MRAQCHMWKRDGAQTCSYTYAFDDVKFYGDSVSIRVGLTRVQLQVVGSEKATLLNAFLILCLVCTDSFRQQILPMH